MKYEIEQGVPVPADRSIRNSKYPFEKMEVGDSFAVPVPDTERAGDYAAGIRTVAYAWGKKRSGKFKVRIEGNHTSIRVWRVA